jgi:hypothetical protein
VTSTWRRPADLLGRSCRLNGEPWSRMGAVDHLLADGERIHLVTREHGVVLLGAFLRATATLLVVGGAAYELSGVHSLGLVPVVSALLAGVVSVRVLLRLIATVARWYSRRLIVTDRKVILLQGPLARRVTALPLRMVDEIEVRRSGALGRCGALLVTSSGRRAPLLGLRRLPQPDLVMGLVLGLSGELREHSLRPARAAGRRDVLVTR